jgi:hypothetical protein
MMFPLCRSFLRLPDRYHSSSKLVAAKVNVHRVNYIFCIQYFVIGVKLSDFIELANFIRKTL